MTEQSAFDVGESILDAVVFAGGGGRCVGQVGFWEALSAKIPVAPRHISCVSAGSAMAAMIFGGGIDEGMAHFLEITAANDKNAYPEHLLKEAPVFPHEAMYSGALRAALDADALAALSAGPTIDVLVARPPRWLPGLGAMALGMGSYNIERHLRHGLHPTWPEKLGYRSDVISFQEVIGEHADDTTAAREAVIDLVLASSCSPPLTPLYRYRGAIALDGGLVDNVPVFAIPPEYERVLVLLTRRYPQDMLCGDARETIVQPSSPIPIKKWDYTSPELIQETYELGLRDGERFASERAS